MFDKVLKIMAYIMIVLGAMIMIVLGAMMLKTSIEYRCVIGVVMHLMWITVGVMYIIYVGGSRE